MHVRPIQQRELPLFAHVISLAMHEDEIMQITAPHRIRHRQSYYNHILLRLRLRFYRGELMYLAVTDSADQDWTGTEQVTGYLSLSTNVPTHKKPTPGGWLGNWFEQQAVAWEMWHMDVFRTNWSVDREAEAAFRRSMVNQKCFEDYFKTLPASYRIQRKDWHWEVELLGVHPEFRRRGVGNLLLQTAFEKAMADETPLMLLATVMGEKLYLSAGFKEIGRVVMRSDDPIACEEARKSIATSDSGQGLGKDVSWAAMVWEPQSVRRSSEP